MAGSPISVKPPEKREHVTAENFRQHLKPFWKDIKIDPENPNGCMVKMMID